MTRRDLDRRKRELLRQLEHAQGQQYQDLVVELELVKDQIAEHDREVAALQNQADTLTVRDLVDRYHIAYLADDHKFSITWNTSDDPENYNVVTKTILADRIIHGLNTLLPADQKILKMRSEDIIKYCDYNRRSFLTMTSSFNAPKWNVGCYNQMLDLKKFWVQPAEDQEPTNPLFDDLIHCLAGGKAENIQHLERWVLYKYARPEDTVNIPHINISGIPGENGKGLFKLLLKTLFTAGSVVDASAKELINGFNAKWKDAVVLIYEEMGERELPENKIKSVTGNPELNVELKGKDAFVTDANYTILFFDNNVNGTVKLAGSGAQGEDRRYSIIETNISLPQYLSSRYGTTLDEAKEQCNRLADLLRSRTEVSRWLRDLIHRHGQDLVSVPKLHGQDYWNRVNNQQTDLDTVARDFSGVLVRVGALPIKLLLKEARTRLGDDNRITAQRLARAVLAELKRAGHSPEKGRVSRVAVGYGQEHWQQSGCICIGIGDLPGRVEVFADPFQDGVEVTELPEIAPWDTY